MPKRKMFYYECVFPDKNGCEVGYWGPDQRRERWPKKGRLAQQPMRVLHSVRFYSADVKGKEDRDGNLLPGDFLGSPKPIGRAYTEETTKNVSRPKIDPETGVLKLGRVMRPKICRQKFRVLEDWEVDRKVVETAYEMDWTDDLYNNGAADVHLPRDAKQASIDAQKPEPAPEVDEEDKPLPAASVKRKAK